jgi:hypothetical protein
MDERTYQVFHQHKTHLAFFTDRTLAVWATSQHVKRHGYTEGQMEAALTEIERQKIDTSPMVHLTERQLDAMLTNYQMPLPTELGEPESTGA